MNLRSNYPTSNDEPKILGLSSGQGAFGWVDGKTGSSQNTQDICQMLHMFLPGGTENNNVIQVSTGILRMATEYLIHQSLESSRRTMETKGENSELEQAPGCAECCQLH